MIISVAIIDKKKKSNLRRIVFILLCVCLGLSGEASVQNPGNLISGKEQTINYNGFNKVSDITETVGTDNYRLDFVYGPDRQRWKTILKKNSSEVKTILFAGDYEKVTANGITQELFYIGDKVICVKQAGQPDKLYFAIKDHLGSIVKIVDNSGATVFAANYDAWGNRTVTNNTFAFHRGFTGHEHLPEFNLINMNGRVYDPILGRFLSPDPFVQAPDLSRNFNRYSYALNNPMKFTDPSGEFAWIPFVFMIFSNAYIQGDRAEMHGGNFWNAAWKGALVGAATYGLSSIAPLGTTWIGSTVWGATVGTATSAGNVWASGSNDYSKIWIGTVTGGVTGFLSSENFENYSRGKGFNSNDKVLENFIKGRYDNDWSNDVGTGGANWYNDALDYFGFRGKYNPNAKPSDVADSKEYLGFTDSETGEISYGNLAFKSYDNLKGTYYKELYTSNKVIAGISISTQDIPKGVPNYYKVAPEEAEGFIYQYKNQGLYHSYTVNSMSNINAFQGQIFDLDLSQHYMPKWWHFIYKIPRRW